MNHQEAMDAAGKYDDELLATDPRFNHRVFLVHRDGSVLLFGSAFLIEQDEWVSVFTEHHSYFVYHKEDLVLYRELDKPAPTNRN